MIYFFKSIDNTKFYVLEAQQLSASDIEKLIWLFDGAKPEETQMIEGLFIGPRKEMVTPWSTNAVEITQNMLITGITRIEEFTRIVTRDVPFDPMLMRLYETICQDIFAVHIKPEPILFIEDIALYNIKEGLALNPDEIEYLDEISRKLGRLLTDSEVFGFSQVNSEHCRHKIFNGTFIIDGIQKHDSLFTLIKNTTKQNPGKVVSAYKDNVAFLKGPAILQFAPANPSGPGYFYIKKIDTVISLKAETHNFPTTVEPFYGAATGSGGEIRDRMAGGKASIPLAGTAVYMTSYPRLVDDREWEKKVKPRKWLYQTPEDILIKASNGASDFGNKFGQPLICGSLLTFEHQEAENIWGYDKVVMLAGGIGYGCYEDSQKGKPRQGDKIVLLGGDNYRIGMGGGAVSSVDTGLYNSSLELNAIQRANPEMQKRVFNTIRALAESDQNPIISNHDHGAGGHLNCLSELVEGVGGRIDIEELPIGDPTLSAKEIIGNESQERMGIAVGEKDIALIRQIAERERSPMYVIGSVTGDKNFCFIAKNGQSPMNIPLEYLFGKPPRTIISDNTSHSRFSKPVYNEDKLIEYIKSVLEIEAVACKDWLTNKVDRSVTGKIAWQQTTGAIQLPLNNLGAVSLDFSGQKGAAISIGHAPAAGLINSANGSILSIAEALTNIVWAPIDGMLAGVSLSANWMWPCKNPGEDARLYTAVEAAGLFAEALGINIPTGKDSLSMTQKYPDGKRVISPGTVIISAAAEVSDVKKIVSPVLKPDLSSLLFYIDFSKDDFLLGGSSFCQILGNLDCDVPTVKDPLYFKTVFDTIQKLVLAGKILAGHDISSGGIITTLLEMNFANTENGINININDKQINDLIKFLFSEKPGVVIQVSGIFEHEVKQLFDENSIVYMNIGFVHNERTLKINNHKKAIIIDIDRMRDIWFKTSYLLDKKQCGGVLALKRYENYSRQQIRFTFPGSFKSQTVQNGAALSKEMINPVNAAIIREKGINGDREMAYAMFAAGFNVKDVHMTDLVSGRETLSDIHFLVFPGGFSNSDVLGSAKGWAGGFLFNKKAKQVLENFYNRENTLSLGVCNGCQVMVALDLIYPEHEKKPMMLHNNSNKFESAFLTVEVLPGPSVMLNSLAGSRLGIWVAHGEGRFSLPYEESRYLIPLKYSYNEYPGNPNGSAFNTAGLVSKDGRHLVMMPHLERAIFPWQWAHYPANRQNDETTPWLDAFVNALNWIKSRI